MPTTLRLLVLLMLGLFGLQPVSFGYDAPVTFVSGAQNIVAASPEIGVPTVESAVSAPSNFSREGGAMDGQANTRTFSNFVAAESGASSSLQGDLLRQQLAAEEAAGVRALNPLPPTHSTQKSNLLSVIGGMLIGGTEAEGAEAAESAAGDVSAATPIGRSGNPLSVVTKDGIPSNTPGTVAGRDYTGHAFDSMQSRGIPPSVVENTVQNGATSAGNVAGRTVHFDPVNNISVVTDSATGRVITVRPGPP